MPAYLVATTVIKDPVKFAAYQKGIAGLSASFGGETLVAGPVTAVLEGDSPPDERVIVSRFASEDDVRAYLTSPQYLAAKPHREGAAEVRIRLIVA